MSFCFFIRHAADSNRIARTGSLLHVHGEMGRGGERRSEKRRCVCVHFHLSGCSSLEPSALLILRYFLSALTQLCAHTHTHTHCSFVYGCAPQLWFICNVLNLTLSKFIVIHFTVILSSLRDWLSLQSRFPWQDCVCHTHAHTNLLFQQQDVCSPVGKRVCWLYQRTRWDSAVCQWPGSAASDYCEVQFSGD